MIVVLVLLATAVIVFAVELLRRRPPATYAPMPPVIDTARHGGKRFDEGRLSGPPYDQDGDAA